MPKRRTKIRWGRPKVREKSPGPRSGHSLVMMGNCGFLFGGIAGQPGQPLDETYTFQLGKKDVLWTHIATKKRPPPRWRHSACFVNETDMVIFGGHHSLEKRLNDLWIFDTLNMTWTEQFSNAPSPRGGHSATIVVVQNSSPQEDDESEEEETSLERMIIFGGYGGTGDARKDLNDLYELDTTTWTWRLMEAKGQYPAERSGHRACAINEGSKIVFFGGWNRKMQFADLYVLDIATTVWSHIPEAALTEPRWNSMACAVVAIPYWKIFVFGGCNSVSPDEDILLLGGEPCDDVAILDVGTMKWTIPEIDDAPKERPGPRSDGVLCYDTKSARLVTFGGWCHQFLGELYTLDISLVVGPPYSISGIDPEQGPVTGGTDLSVTGIDFFRTTEVTVRFGTSSKYLDARGTFVKQTEIRCLTPDFSDVNDGRTTEVQVRVALDDDSFTTSCGIYTFFSVADAKCCLMFGPGLLRGGAAKEPPTIYIQARDKANLNRTTGGDEFHVNIRRRPDGTDDEEEEDSVRQLELTDNDDGTYELKYTPLKAGEYDITVEFAGTYNGNEGPIRGSGAVAEFVDVTPATRRESVANNTLAGKLIQEALAKDMAFIESALSEMSTGMHLEIPEFSEEGETQRIALVTVKESLDKMKKRKSEIDLVMDRGECTLEAMQAQSVRIGPQLENIRELKKTWTEMQKDAPKILKKIKPLITKHRAKTKRDIDAYQNEAATFLEEVVKQGDYKKANTGAERALELLSTLENDEFAKELEKLEVMTRLAKIFLGGDDDDSLVKSKEIIDTAKLTIASYRILWETSMEISHYIDEASEMFWTDVDGKGLEENGAMLLQKVRRLHKFVKPSDAYKKLEKSTLAFADACPLVSHLQHPSIQPRHWDELRSLTNASLTEPFLTNKTRLRDFLNLGLHRHRDKVDDVVEKAAREARQEATLQKIAATWKKVCFRKTPKVLKGRDDDNEEQILMLSLSREDTNQLEADILALQTIEHSRIEYGKKRAAEWRRSLSTVDAGRRLLNDIQQSWCYLEPLFFESEDIGLELPDETDRFKDVDTSIRAMLKSLLVGGDGTVLPAFQHQSIGDLEHTLELLDFCRKDVSQFVLRKCSTFPRFFFVDEAALLRLLARKSSAGSYPLVAHGTGTIVLDDKEMAVGFTSAFAEEVIRFSDKPPRLEGQPVEVAVAAILEAQKTTLQASLRSSLARYPTQERLIWIQHKNKDQQDPAQIVLLIAAIQFTKSVEDAMRSITQHNKTDAMTDYRDRVLGDLDNVVRLTQTSLTPGERQRIESIVLFDAHCRDVVASLIKGNVVKRNDFLWKAQLRTTAGRPSSSGDSSSRPTSSSGMTPPKVLMCDASFLYEFEYLGNGPRIVITPLTERCYATALLAFRSHLGCLVAGPPGVGKTETSRSLAQALGTAFFVFDSVDVVSLGTIFKGLASAGVWIAVEGVHRLATDVLSIFVVQFRAVSQGLALLNEDRAFIDIDGDSTELRPKGAMFISMDPSVAGSQLHSLFRPVSIVAPETQLICEVFLLAKGFTSAAAIASKYSFIYKLMDELGRSTMCDWTMHSLKSLVAVLGRAKHDEPTVPEEELAVRVLRSFYAPRMTTETAFFKVLDDVFPKLQDNQKLDEPAAETTNGLSTECITAAMEDLRLWPEEDFRQCVADLHHLMTCRPAVIIVGEPGIGKTTAWRTLAHVYNKEMEPVETAVLDPNVFTLAELYGSVDERTSTWRDGALTSMLRTKTGWLVLDGDLAEWSDALYGVIDNGVMMLGSKERLETKVRLVFEVASLRRASPGIVGRTAVLHVNDTEGKRWRSLVAAWLTSRSDDVYNDENRKLIGDLVEQFVAAILAFLTEKTTRTLSDVSLVAGFLSMLDSALTTTVLSHAVRVTTMFGFCCIWAFGSALTVTKGRDERGLFSDWWRKKLNTLLPVRVPAKDDIFAYGLDPVKNTFAPWVQLSKKSSSSKKKNFAFEELDSSKAPIIVDQVLVPTAESTAVHYWGRLLLPRRRPIAVMGPQRTGKTLIVDAMLREHAKVNKTDYVRILSSQGPIDAMSKRLAVVPGGLGPTEDGGLVFWIDDLSQDTTGILRELLDRSTWCDPRTNEVTSILNCQYVTCSTTTTSTADDLSDDRRRLDGKLTPFAVLTKDVSTIYQAILEGHFRKLSFPMAVSDMIPNVLKAMLALDVEMKGFASPLLVGPKHLADICKGLLLTTPESNEIEFPDDVVRLWAHESCRAYGHVADESRFVSSLLTVAQKQFPGVRVTEVLEGLLPSEEEIPPLCYCHYRHPDVTDRSYGRILDVDSLRQCVLRGLDQYHSKYSQKSDHDLVFGSEIFFDATLLLLTKISRSISVGHVLLTGGSSLGLLNSLTLLAAHLCGLESKTLVTSNLTDVQSDVKELCMQAGLKNDRIVLFVADAFIQDDGILKFLADDLMANPRAMVDKLFAPDERDPIAAMMEASSPKKKKGGTFWTAFVDTVATNLRIVYACEATTPRVTRYLAARTTVVRVLKWDRPALDYVLQAQSSVKLNKLLNRDKDNDDDDDDESEEVVIATIPASRVRDAAASFLPGAYLKARDLAVGYGGDTGRFLKPATPAAYGEMLDMYGELLIKLLQTHSDRIERLENGIDKVKDAVSCLKTIEHDAKLQRRDAENKRQIAEGLRDRVDKDTEILKKHEKQLDEKTQNVELAKAALERAMDDAEKELSRGAPYIDGMNAAVEQLQEGKTELAALKATVTPTNMDMADVFGAACVLLAGINPKILVQNDGTVNEKDRSWESMKKSVLANINGCVEDFSNFKDLIDQGKVPEKNMQQIRGFLRLDAFVHVKEDDQSATASVIHWIHNAVAYYDVWIDVEPKRRAVFAAREKLEKAKLELEEITALVTKLRLALEKLTKEYEDAERRRFEAYEIVRKTVLRVELGQRLINAVGPEEQRWETELEEQHGREAGLVGDAMMASAFLSYAGAFDPDRRALLLNQWQPEEEPKSNPRPIVDVVADDKKVRQWYLDGLPREAMARENAAIVTRRHHRRWPLLVDPQLQGLAWIKKHFVQTYRGFKQVNINDVAAALKVGSCVVFEDLTEINGILMPLILLPQRRRHGYGRRVSLDGVREVDVHDDFSLILQTRQSRPQFFSALTAELVIVEFTLSEEALEHQLRHLVLQMDRPDLATRHAGSLHNRLSLEIDVAALEEDILYRLNANEEEPAEDRDFIAWLESTVDKVKANENDMADDRKALDAIDGVTEQHEHIAKRGAELFFFLTLLYCVDPAYVYSLNFFVLAFQAGIDKVLADERQDRINLKNDVSSAEDNKAARRKSSLVNKLKSAVKKSRDHRYDHHFDWDEDLLSKASLPEKPHDLPALSEHLLAEKHAEFDFEHQKLHDVEAAFRRDSMLTAVTDVVYRVLIEAGVFAKDRLTVATLFALFFAERKEHATADEIRAFLTTVKTEETVPSGLDFVPDDAWRNLLGLELTAREPPQALTELRSITTTILNDPDAWRPWFLDREVERLPIPDNEIASAVGTKEMLHLALIRAARPDRLPAALKTFSQRELGCDPLRRSVDVPGLYSYTSPSVPLLFLGQGDAARVVGSLARDFGILDDDEVHFIDMSGCQAHAERSFQRAADHGGWLLLEDVPLDFFPTLEACIFEASKSADKNFRCFLTTRCETSLIPEGLLVKCVKLIDETPLAFGPTVSRAWRDVSFRRPSLLDDDRPRELTRLLAGLCVLHSQLVLRRQWDNIETSDLLFGASMIERYVQVERRCKDGATSKTLWTGLQTLIGEVVYAGVSNVWDQRVVKTYAAKIFREDLMRSDFDLAQGVPAPAIKDDPAHVAAHFETYAAHDTPELLGVHPTADTAHSKDLARRIVTSACSFNIAAAPGLVRTLRAENTSARGMIDDLGERAAKLPRFSLSIDEDKKTLPYVDVAMEECILANAATTELRHHLDDARRLLTGEVSDAADDTLGALARGVVPRAWGDFSGTTLDEWMSGIEARLTQLTAWTERFELPTVLRLGALWNPVALLTAVKRLHGTPLDFMTLETHVVASTYDVNEKPRNGIFVNGLFCTAGAHWRDDDGQVFPYDEDNVPCAGALYRHPNDLVSAPMPIIYLKATPHQNSPPNDTLAASAFFYECPVVYRAIRSSLFTAVLRTAVSPETWILRGVVLVLLLER